MRIVIDLQGAQGVNRNRGIGRLSRALARAMIIGAGPHETFVLVNEAAPEAAEQLLTEFSALLPRQNICFWRGIAKASAIGDAESVARRRASERIRAQRIAGLEADVVFMTSVVEGATDDTVTNWPSGLMRPPHVATFYDAIPLMNPDQYLRGIWKPLAGWYLGQVQELRLCDGLVAISESARQEAIDYLNYDPAQVENIRAGFDRAVFRPVAPAPDQQEAFLSRHGLRADYILFVGAGDARKNELGLLQAYALLPEALRRRHQLVIVGASYPERLQETAASYGVGKEDLGLIRHVSEDDLPIMYALSGVFVMPSKHEGFGLPALEAMACGAAVIASGTTSLPEVVGREDALFDPNDPASIALKLKATLEDAAFRQDLKLHGLARAEEFTWEESARRCWAALEGWHARNAFSAQPTAGSVAARKPRLAYVSTCARALSGLPDTGTDLLPELARYYDITLVTDTQSEEGLDRVRSIFPTMPTSRFAADLGFDRIVYDLRDTEPHSEIVRRLLPRQPGVVILNDPSLNGIAFAEFRRTGEKERLARILFESHGWPAVAALPDQPTQAALQEWPCTLPLFQDALAIIQHSRKASVLATRRLGPEFEKVVTILPHCRWTAPPITKARAREQLQLPSDALVVCSIVAGRYGQHAMDLLSIWKEIIVTRRDARFVFVGSVPSELESALRESATQGGFVEQFIITGRLEFDRYGLWLAAADIALQLDQASVADATDAIVDAMAAGLPVMIPKQLAELGQFPAATILTVKDDASQGEIVASLREILADTERLAALAHAASRYARVELSPAIVASGYRSAIEQAYSQGEMTRLQAVLPDMPEGNDETVVRALAETFTVQAPQRLMLGIATGPLKSVPTHISSEWVRDLLKTSHEGWIVETVRFDDEGLRCSRSGAATLLGLDDYGLRDTPVLGSAKDILVLSDTADCLSGETIQELRRLRRRGVRLILMPDDTPDEIESDILRLADGVLCASAAIADRYRAAIERCRLMRCDPIPVSVVNCSDPGVTHAFFDLLQGIMTNPAAS
ncbi:glycosyltransferase involved in cell wall biosynthesis [Paraburkholderia sp. GAS206C]|uniref:glycosyltransferase n=1 Tax=unclassified Paraburkholderia TaxID=2615204 RepID=UPI003D1FA4F1